MAFYSFTFMAVFYWINWIGFLFALKPFDRFANTCKDNWFWFALATFWNTWLAIGCYLRPEDYDSVYIDVALFIWTLFFLCYVFPIISDNVAKFHSKQKAKRQ